MTVSLVACSAMSARISCWPPISRGFAGILTDLRFLPIDLGMPKRDQLLDVAQGIPSLRAISRPRTEFDGLFASTLNHPRIAAWAHCRLSFYFSVLQKPSTSRRT